MDADRGKRLDSLLRERLPEYSRSRLQSWIREGRVTVEGQAVRASSVLRGGEHISVEPRELTPLRAVAEDI
ncbi:MAG TPA: S4 domain-containing protein, partial [Bryobacteraceae bacterium]|nr:S4 domain-containing protein [Bryobacteraceae bacterium]